MRLPVRRLQPAEAPEEAGRRRVAPDGGGRRAAHAGHEVARHAGQLHVGRRLRRRVRLYVGEALLTVAGQEAAGAVPGTVS